MQQFAGEEFHFVTAYDLTFLVVFREIPCAIWIPVAASLTRLCRISPGLLIDRDLRPIPQKPNALGAPRDATVDAPTVAHKGVTATARCWKHSIMNHGFVEKQVQYLLYLSP